MGFTLAQFKEWVATTFANNTSRAIGENDFRDGLDKMADYAYEQIEVSSEQAGIATTKAGEASASASAAAGSAATATNEAGVSTDMADAAIAAKNLAVPAATTAVTKAGEAATSAANANDSKVAAGVSETNASNSAIAANASKVAAGISETNSAASAAAALLSQDAALIQAGVYATEAAGRAAVADGQAFKVQGTGDVAAYEYRKIDSANSILIGSYPSSDLVSALKNGTNLDSYPGEIIGADPEGRVFVRFNTSGADWIGRAAELIELAKVKNVTITYDDRLIFCDINGNVFFESSVAGVNWKGRAEELDGINKAVAIANQIINGALNKISFSDIDGNEFFRADPTGINYVGKAETDTALSKLKTASIPLPTYISDYFQIIIYGQSLSVSGAFNGPIDFYDAKTFTGGILTNYDPDTAGAADTYFGSSLVDLPTVGSETQGKGLVRVFKDLIISENKVSIPDQSFVPVVNAPGAGGISNYALMDPTGDYLRRLLESVRRGKDFSIAQGKSYSVPVLCYIQGESSADRFDTLSQWYNKLDSSFSTLNSSIKAITGQVEDVQFIVYQIASDMAKGTGVPLGFLKLCKDKPNVHFGCSMYQMTYTDALHVDNDSTRMMGAMMGVVAKRIIVDKVKMHPIGVNSYSIQKNESNTTWLLRLKMNVPVKPLVFDETVNSLFVSPPTKKGFEIKNVSNVNIITAVSIIHGDTINILCSENPAGLTLNYAIGGRDSGGNLRDSQGDSVKITLLTGSKRVDNWCPIFSQVL